MVTVGALALAAGLRPACPPATRAAAARTSTSTTPSASSPAFLIAWSYWISGWAGNAGIAVAWVGYVNEFVPVLDNRLTAVAATLVGIWLPALVVVWRVRNIGGFRIVTTAIKFAALLFVAVVGLFFVKSAIRPAQRDRRLRGCAVRGRRDPAVHLHRRSRRRSWPASCATRRNIGRATILGTLAAALVYIVGIVTVFGTVGQMQLRASTAPFADAVDAMFGGTAGGYVMSAAAVISGLGALTGWTLVTAELSYGAARDGAFRSAFTRTRRDIRGSACWSPPCSPRSW